MNWPTSQDYNEAVQDPAMSFSDPGLKGGEVVVNALGLPVPRSGNFADVYQFRGADGKTWALKCFTRKVAGLKERYARIDEHLNKARLPFNVGFKFLQEGVKIRGEWYPLLKMEWVEGFTLNDFVAENLGKPQYLHALVQMWAKLSGRLRDADMAHADLQHGNVLLVPGATPQKLGLKLIDYDGMWVPALSGTHSGEVGHPNYQHPLRLKERLYNGDVDRFPHLVIAAGLRAALVGGRPLWEKFDNGDNLLFKEADLRDPARAEVFKALWNLNDPVLRTLVGHIALSAKEPLRKTPWLDDVLLAQGGPKLSIEQERQVCDLLGVSMAAPTGAAAVAPAAIEQEFNVFQFLDEDEPAKPAEAKASGRRVVPKRKPAKKSSMGPLLIGGGIGAAVLIAGGIVAAVLAFGGKKGPTTEVVQNKEKEKEREPVEGTPKTGGDPTPPKVLPKNVRPAANLGSVVTRDDLRQALAGTKWDWGDGTLELRADGTAFHTGWSQNPGLNKRWEAVDRRTVVLIVAAGRDFDRTALLEFSEDLGQFTGFDFIGVERMPDKKRAGPLGRPDFRPPTGTPTRDARQELHQAVAGSQWEWDGERMTLNANGSVSFPVQPGKVAWAARWEPVDRRTAAVVIPQGKARDRLAVFQFSEDSRQLTGYDFAGAVRLPARKRLDAGAAPAPSPRTAPVIAVATVSVGSSIAGPANMPVKAGPPPVPRELAKDAIENDQTKDLPADPLKAVAVRRGEKIWFTVHAKRNDQYDTTTVQLVIREAREGGRSWDIRDLVNSTPEPARPWGVFEVRAGAEGPRPFTRFEPMSAGIAGLVAWQGEAEWPSVRVNTTDRLIALKSSTHPPKMVAFHPTRETGVAVAWESPIDGIVMISGQVRNLDNSGGEGIAWTLTTTSGSEPAALPAGGRSYLFAREGDPALYLSVNGPASRATVVGRGDSAIRALATSRDGSRAITGHEDGEVRLWTFPSPRVTLGRRLAGYDAIGLFQDRFGIDYYERGIVFRDNQTGREEVVPVGKAGPAVAARFEGSLAKNDKLARDLGAPLTEEVKLFGGAVIVEAFEGGAMTFNPTVNKMWWSWHAKRKPADDAPPAAPTEVTGVTIKEHDIFVATCAISPDGTRAVTVGLDKQLCEWDLFGAKLIQKFPVTPGRTVAYLPGGKTILLGTEEGSAEVWDLETKARTRELPGHKEGVPTVYVSPHNDFAWTAGNAGEVQAWALSDFRSVGALPGIPAPVSAFAVSRMDTRVLAIAGGDGTIRFFDPKTGRSYGSHVSKAEVRGLAFLPGRLDLVAGREPDPIVIRVSAPDGMPVPDPMPAESPPSPSPKGSSVLKLLAEADSPAQFVHRMGYSTDGKYLWLSSADTVTVADGATGKALKTFNADGRNVLYAAFGPNNHLYLVLAGGKFQAWDWDKGERLREYDPAEAKGPLAAAVWPLPTANRVLVSTHSPALLVWDTARWREAERLTPYGNDTLTMAAPVPGANRFVAMAGLVRDPRLVIWDVGQKKEVARMDIPAGLRPYQLEASPGSRWVLGHARDGNDGTLTIWNARTGKVAHTLPGIKVSLVGGGFSPAGDRYLFVDQAGRRQVVTLADGKMTDETAGRPPSNRAAGAPGANLLATADADRKVRIWRFDPDAKGPPVAAVPEPPMPMPTPVPATNTEGFLKDSPELSGRVVGAAVSTDGKKVFAVTQKGMLHVLDAVTGEEKAKHELSKGRPIHIVLVPKGQTASGADRLYLLCDDRHLLTVDPEKGTKLREVDLTKATLPAPTSGSRLAITPNESHVMVFDPAWTQGYSWANGTWGTGAVPLGLQKAPFNKTTKTVAFSVDGSVGVAHASGKMLVWRARGGREIRAFDLPSWPEWLAVAADAGVVAAGESSGRLQAWKYDTGAEVMSVREPHGFRQYFAAATGHWLVTAGEDRSLKVWDLTTGKERVQWRLSQSPAGLSVSADGRTAVVWYDEGDKLGLWALPEVKGKKQ